MANSKGGKSKETTNSSVTIPGWLTAASINNIGTANALPDYVPYSGERVAGLNGDQQQAFDLLRGNVGQAQGVAQQGIDGAASAVGFNPTQLTAAGLAPEIQGLLNPYDTAVVDAAHNDLERARVIREQQNGAMAAKSHAFGGDRHGVVDALNNRDFTDAFARTSADLRRSGYEKALASALTMGQSNQAAASDAAKINLAGSNALIGAAPVVQGLNAADAQGLLTAGGMIQGNQQAQNDAAYQEFIRSQDQPYKRLDAMIKATATAPHDKNSVSTTEKEMPSNPVAGILGAGLGIAGLLSGNPMGLLGGGGLGVGGNFGGGLLGGIFGGGNPTGFAVNPFTTHGNFQVPMAGRDF